MNPERLAEINRRALAAIAELTSPSSFDSTRYDQFDSHSSPTTVDASRDDVGQSATDTRPEFSFSQYRSILRLKSDFDSAYRSFNNEASMVVNQALVARPTGKAVLNPYNVQPAYSTALSEAPTAIRQLSQGFIAASSAYIPTAAWSTVDSEDPLTATNVYNPTDQYSILRTQIDTLNDKVSELRAVREEYESTYASNDNTDAVSDQTATTSDDWASSSSEDWTSANEDWASDSGED